MSRPALQLEPVAVFTHDYSPCSPLRSWPPVPADSLHQGEQLALHAFGSLLADIRSPRHLYFTSWRDPDPAALLPGCEDVPPAAILFNGLFGIAPYETSASLLDTANMFNLLDRASLRLDLVSDGDGTYRLGAIELEINHPVPPKGRHFRSCWKGEEVRSLDLALQYDAPATRRDPFRFHISGRLPRRYNHGAAIEAEHVQFAASGGAMHLPAWVNY